MAVKVNVLKKAQAARKAALAMAVVPAKKKVAALKAMAKAIRTHEKKIITANKKDVAVGKKRGLTGALMDRLMLDAERIEKMAQAVELVASLKEPVGKVDIDRDMPEGFNLQKVRVPIGVVAIIYESRPNVTADAASLCLKSGNAVLLKGGSESIYSNTALVKILQDAVKKVGLPTGVIEFINTTDRQAVSDMLVLDDFIDVVIPRGGETLIRAVVAQARMPVIKHYKGVCHIYVDDAANLAMAQRVALNAKIQRPGVCNAMETLLLNNKLPQAFLKKILAAFGAKGVEIRGGAAIKKLYSQTQPVNESDWGAEYLDLVLAVKLVKNMDEAIEHINTYGSRHTDAIITKNKKRAALFVAQVDSSSVMINATTRLADGGVYGLGAEVGISTDKIGARGPMGIDDLTTYKWVVTGKGTIRP